ncbi:MAG TPA: hypothetical protein PK052_10715 [Anaerohalosphaeraceae bacterium]|nr:hypothetical protein [Phycisphaerae bacterium]HOK95647.1 hypothetical protein [Anaerohalosphaeraceae bacterium]HOL32442.1 hypothetical protein [Anaerohalosphaeraceae bacterium]HOM77576.1 hypothetical protein [Anaerohalosphaeraceae bacterium]HPC64228.1 hypothetical protein [Anaerohalosphaeraceae bacterium]
MWNIFENSWLLLTAAGIALIAAGIIRQSKPEWGCRALLIPLLLAVLAFGLDAAVTTDYEAIVRIIRSCRQAAVKADASAIMRFVSPRYTDSIHRDKAALAEAAEHILKKASIKKVRIQSHIITTEQPAAQSRLLAAVHLHPNSAYASAGSLVFVELNLEYEKIGKTWSIRRAEVAAINYTPFKWHDAR